MNRLLLIIDPQVDFVTGSLKVEGAVGAMDALAHYICEHGNMYSQCVITADWHPFNHLSFIMNGGRWPRHCVAYSVGAAIYPPVYDAAMSCCRSVDVLTKGTSCDHEEYSIFANDVSASKLDEIILKHRIDAVDICGLAGDVCVSDTLVDGINKYGIRKIKVLERFSPSIDGGVRLNELLTKYQIKCDR